jgi:hypothetical protein
LHSMDRGGYCLVTARVNYFLESGEAPRPTVSPPATQLAFPRRAPNQSRPRERVPA